MLIFRWIKLYILLCFIQIVIKCIGFCITWLLCRLSYTQLAIKCKDSHQRETRATDCIVCRVVYSYIFRFMLLPFLRRIPSGAIKSLRTLKSFAALSLQPRHGATAQPHGRSNGSSMSRILRFACLCFRCQCFWLWLLITAPLENVISIITAPRLRNLQW